MGKYTAKPIEVEAFVMERFEEHCDFNGYETLCDDGSIRHVTLEMMARYRPTEGDYFVIQPDGYEYINPKAVFESKYEPLIKGTGVDGGSNG